MFDNRVVVGALFALAVLSIPSAANAATVLDRSPAVIGGGGGSLAPVYPGQNFLVQFTLASPATLRAAAIYSSYYFKSWNPYTNSWDERYLPAIGSPAIVKFRSDLFDNPSTTNLHEISTSLAARDYVDVGSKPNMLRMVVDFAPISFAAGTYWFGLSSSNSFDVLNWELSYPNATPPGRVVQLRGNDVASDFGTTTNAWFALYDSPVGVVPEPASWAMLLVGFGLIGAAMRQRARRASVAA